jgi:peptidoglycan/LPS O-acetylase OafA/YrhL
MRSSTGQHFAALDHVRAVAAFLVFSWHFIHGVYGTPVPFNAAPLFPFAIFDEGHTGVSLFMVLSGYLFAKLLDGRRYSYAAFLWNRFVRLAPLLILVFLLVGLIRALRGESLWGFVLSLPKGLLLPTWPNGGWSITTEIHFYLLLPVLLILARRSRTLLIAAVLVAVMVRGCYFLSNGEVQSVAYWTIMGRIDQFVLGVAGFAFAREIASRPVFVAAAAVGFLIFWWWFDRSGGYFFRPTYPSPSPLWIVVPTIEGIGYASVIAWYDSRTISLGTIPAKVLQKLGEYSYSIYLLHFFVVYRLARYVHEDLMDLSNFYVALIWSAVCFLLMLVPGYLSFRFVESPFLRLRRKYVLGDAAPAAGNVTPPA